MAVHACAADTQQCCTPYLPHRRHISGTCWHSLNNTCRTVLGPAQSEPVHAWECCLLLLLAAIGPALAAETLSCPATASEAQCMYLEERAAQRSCLKTKSRPSCVGTRAGGIGRCMQGRLLAWPVCISALWASCTVTYSHTQACHMQQQKLYSATCSSRSYTVPHAAAEAIQCHMQQQKLYRKRYMYALGVHTHLMPFVIP